MANEFTASFEGSLDSFNPNFKFHNGTNSAIYSVAFSGKTAQFPITWDSIGQYEGKPTLAGTKGEDEEVVYMYFYDFAPGETVYFNGGDLDYTGDSSSVVPVSAIEGTKMLVILQNGLPLTAEFKVNKGRMEAVVTAP